MATSPILEERLSWNTLFRGGHVPILLPLVKEEWVETYRANWQDPFWRMSRGAEMAAAYIIWKEEQKVK